MMMRNKFTKAYIRTFLIDRILSKSVGRYLRVRADLVEKHVTTTKKPSIWPILVQRSLEDTAEFIEKEMLATATYCFSRREIFDVAINLLPSIEQELIRVYEFGVYNGGSLSEFCPALPNATIFAFDSFMGLPSDWTGTHTRAGYFNLNGEVPNSLKNMSPNLKLVVGWYTDTLPNFHDNYPEERDNFIHLIHIDCDIYNSVKEVLDFVSTKVASCTLILFDEYFGYPNWRQHEFKAFQEFLVRYNFAIEYVAFTTRQVLVKIL